MSKSRNFCFTDYKLNKEFWDEIIDDAKIAYMIIGQEICPSSKRIHWQGFVRFTNARSIKSVRKLLEPRHTEMCNGTEMQNCVYCKKDNNLIMEIGDKPHQGRRRDLEDLKLEMLYTDKSVDDITMENPMLYHQYGRTLNRLEDIILRKKRKTEMTTCKWLYGPTGTGKSHEAFKNYDEETHYVWHNDRGWWDGYTGQETVIMNDYRGELPYSELLQLIDKYPCRVSRRQREPAPFLAKLIIITSSLTPDQIYWHRDNEDKLDQLLRRIEIVHMVHKWPEGNTKTSGPTTDERIIE